MIRFTKKHPNFEGVKWVISARSTDFKTREELTRVKVENLDDDEYKLTCTDGHRLHIYKDFIDEPELKAGVYEIISNTAKEIVLNLHHDDNYPPYEKVLPSDDKKQIYQFSVKPAFLKKSLAQTTSNFIARSAIFNFSAFTYDVCKDTFLGITEKLDFFKPDGLLSGVYFKSELGRFSGVIMPLRLMDDESTDRIKQLQLCERVVSQLPNNDVIKLNSQAIKESHGGK